MTGPAAFSNGLGRRVRRAAVRFRRYDLDKRLRKTPVEALRDAGASNARWVALGEAGIESVADLDPWTLDALTAEEGIGRRTAETVKSAAAQLTSELREQPPRPPAPELTEPGALQLARAALGFLAARQALGDVPARLAQVGSRLEGSAGRGPEGEVPSERPRNIGRRRVFVSESVARDSVPPHSPT